MAENKTETAKSKSAKAKKADTFCVYLGPNIRGTIQSGKVYRGSKEETLKKLAPAIEKFPLISSLIAPEERLAAERLKVKTPGNLLYENYKKLASGGNR